LSKKSFLKASSFFLLLRKQRKTKKGLHYNFFHGHDHFWIKISKSVFQRSIFLLYTDKVILYFCKGVHYGKFYLCLLILD
jgi:hypothetical protein